MKALTISPVEAATDGPRPPRWRGFARQLEPVTSGGGAVFVVSLAAANLGNLVFHIIASRRLGPESYGALGAVLALMLAVSLPAAALQVAVTKSAGERITARSTFSARGVAVTVGALASAMALSIMIASPAIKEYLGLTSTRPVLWAAAFLVPAFVGSVARGVLLADLRFAAVAASVLTGTGVKVVLAVVLLDGNDSVSKAIAVNAFSELVLGLMLLGLARSRFAARGHSLRVPWRDTITSAFGFSGLWAMLAVDLVLAQHYLATAGSGDYVAAATVARAVLFVPQSIALVAHARIISARPSEVRGILRGATIATVSVSFAMVAALFSSSWFIIPLLFGSGYTPGVETVLVLAITAGLLALTNLFVHYRLALGIGVRSVWLGVLVLWATALTGHGSVLQIAMAASAGAGAAALVTRPRSWRAPVSPQPGDKPMHQVLPATDIDVSVVLAVTEVDLPVVDRARSVAACLLDCDQEFEIIVVTPRSPSDITETLAAIDPARLRVVPHDHGDCRGGALRAGAAVARGRHVVLLDVGSDISPAHIPHYLELLSFYAADVVVGSKRHPDSRVSYPPLRRIYSWAYQQLVRVLFKVSVRDLQVGIKVITRETVADALPHTSEEGFVFELELLSVARMVGHRRVVEAPVAIDHRFSHAVPIRITLREVAATLGLRARLPRLARGIPHYAEDQRPSPGATPAAR